MHAVYVDHMGDDKSVVRAARVSFAQQDTTFDETKDAKLIKYLADHNHWTPFAHTAITLRMTAPVPIRTQCFKHKQGFVENEESRRYIKDRPQVYQPLWREAVKNKKQGSGKVLTSALLRTENREYDKAMRSAIASYERAIARGVCEEQARLYLPQGCEVNWYWTGSLAAFSRFAHLRLDPHAQVEIQVLAWAVSDIIKPLFPVAWGALTDNIK